MTFPQTIDEINERISYRLTFRGTDEPRGWYQDMLDGPDLPDARPDVVKRFTLKDEGLSPGSWMIEFDDHDDPREFVLTAVVAEAIHEAMEWLRLDGRVFIDPHAAGSGVTLRAAQGAVIELLKHLDDGVVS